MPKINLGDKVRDTITGYTGIAIGRTEWINGCTRIVVQSNKLKEDGTPSDSQHIDEPQCELIKPAKQKAERVETGGPVPMPKRAENPKR